MQDTRPGWLDPQLYPFRSQFLRVDGNWLHYIDEGAGPVLLFLHGNPTWSFVYRDVIRALTSRFRCVALDYPGFGLSRGKPGFGYSAAEQSALVARFVEALDLQAVTPVMHDWGGPIGLRLAERQLSRMHGLVLLNTWAWPLAGRQRLTRLSRLMAGPLGELFGVQISPVDAALRLGTRGKLSAPVRRAYSAPFPNARARAPIRILARELCAARPLLETVLRELPKLRSLPKLLIWGERDPFFTARDRARLQCYFPDMAVHRLANAGHFVQEDAAGEIAGAIWNWHAPVHGAP